jgi:excinuclease ABC subunit C
LPQLVVIDGGKGQLNAAIRSLEKLQLRGKVAIIGIAKKLEEIYFPDDPVPLYIDKNSESLKLIQQLRNEAHRFGITFHRLKRSGAFTKSTLEAIDGVGSKSVEKLFKRFKSLEKIRHTPIEILAEEVGETRARLILEHLKEV